MHLVRGNIISIPACVHLKSAWDKRSLLVAVPSPPPPLPGETEARQCLRKPDTNRVPRQHSFARKYIMTLNWLTPFADSLVNSDWFELVIYFHISEQDDELDVFTVNFSDNSDLRRGFKASLRDFWDRDITRRTAKSNRYYVFRK